MAPMAIVKEARERRYLKVKPLPKIFDKVSREETLVAGPKISIIIPPPKKSPFPIKLDTIGTLPEEHMYRGREMAAEVIIPVGNFK